jgi:hypothetical protein
MKIKFIALYGCVLLPLLAADSEAFVIWPKGVPPGGPKALRQRTCFAGGLRSPANFCWCQRG